MTITHFLPGTPTRTSGSPTGCGQGIAWLVSTWITFPSGVSTGVSDPLEASFLAPSSDAAPPAIPAHAAPPASTPFLINSRRFVLMFAAPPVLPRRLSHSSTTRLALLQLWKTCLTQSPYQST